MENRYVRFVLTCSAFLMRFELDAENHKRTQTLSIGRERRRAEKGREEKKRSVVFAYVIVFLSSLCVPTEFIRKYHIQNERHRHCSRFLNCCNGFFRFFFSSTRSSNHLYGMNVEWMRSLFYFFLFGNLNGMIKSNRIEL